MHFFVIHVIFTSALQFYVVPVLYCTAYAYKMFTMWSKLYDRRDARKQWAVAARTLYGFWVNWSCLPTRRLNVKWSLMERWHHWRWRIWTHWNGIVMRYVIAVLQFFFNLHFDAVAQWPVWQHWLTSLMFSLTEIRKVSAVAQKILLICCAGVFPNRYFHISSKSASLAEMSFFCG